MQVVERLHRQVHASLSVVASGQVVGKVQVPRFPVIGCWLATSPLFLEEGGGHQGQ